MMIRILKKNTVGVKGSLIAVRLLYVLSPEMVQEADIFSFFVLLEAGGFPNWLPLK